MLHDKDRGLGWEVRDVGSAGVGESSHSDSLVGMGQCRIKDGLKEMV